MDAYGMPVAHTAPMLIGNGLFPKLVFYLQGAEKVDGFPTCGRRSQKWVNIPWFTLLFQEKKLNLLL
ncbi:hypothetical protein EYZ11_000907 [Aspergillus tanneri]|uniref:Uncharacterized protein n=1 Tax=Aspergillus tanneri TaxID=1220188 RepID=A0A4V6RQZ1_9EURO|nr:hypothetical protein EYZ11_000907 [Aspergillus tanneri]